MWGGSQRRRVFVDAIEHYVTVHNKDSKPFVWTAKANDILQKVIGANIRLSSNQNEALHWLTAGLVKAWETNDERARYRNQ